MSPQIKDADEDSIKTINNKIPRRVARAVYKPFIPIRAPPRYIPLKRQYSRAVYKPYIPIRAPPRYIPLKRQDARTKSPNVADKRIWKSCDVDSCILSRASSVKRFKEEWNNVVKIHTKENGKEQCGIRSEFPSTYKEMNLAMERDETFLNDVTSHECDTKIEAFSSAVDVPLDHSEPLEIEQSISSEATNVYPNFEKLKQKKDSNKKSDSSLTIMSKKNIYKYEDKMAADALLQLYEGNKEVLPGNEKCSEVKKDCFEGCYKLYASASEGASIKYSISSSSNKVDNFVPDYSDVLEEQSLKKLFNGFIVKPIDILKDCTLSSTQSSSIDEEDLEILNPEIVDDYLIDAECSAYIPEESVEAVLSGFENYGLKDVAAFEYINDITESKLADTISTPSLKLESKHKNAAKKDIDDEELLDVSMEYVRRMRNRDHAKKSRQRATKRRRDLREENEMLDTMCENTVVEILKLDEMWKKALEWLNGHRDKCKSRNTNSDKEEDGATACSKQLVDDRDDNDVERTDNANETSGELQQVKNDFKNDLYPTRQQKAVESIRNITNNENIGVLDNAYRNLLSPWDVQFNDKSKPIVA